MTHSDLITNHIPLVRSIANRLDNPSLKDDLVGEGMVALVKCAEKFDPDCGITLGAYAKHRIRGAMIHYLRKNSGDATEPLGDYERTIGNDGQADTCALRDTLQHCLHPIEEWVIVKRYFDKNSFQDIESELGLTQERVSQIHSNAIRKLKTALGPTEDAPQEESDDNQDALLQVVRKMIWDEWGVEVVEV